MAKDDAPLTSWDAFTDSDSEPDDANGNNVDLNKLPQNLRSLKLSEAADNDFVEDLFSVSDKKVSGAQERGANDVFANNPLKAIIPADPLAHVSLKCFKDCDVVAKKLSQKIEQSPAKSAIWLQFLDVLFQSCEKKLELKDLQTLKRKIESAIKNREAKQREQTFAKKKPNDITSSRNYQDELDMLYGELSDDEEPYYYT
ncbi:hypothetical protein BgAZ_305720 [Babesia gibsoni]|uniref:Uncharacterized protein n=1 Tax=Babesia gibsoni TaxID=33632 RepID=A0AAD8LIX1_BABGI|nr:hypothetical protein BgAZ_305720 [Babesia gibsoni]